MPLMVDGPKASIWQERVAGKQGAASTPVAR